jgi:hypothetical protein
MFLGFTELFHVDLHGIDDLSNVNINECYITVLTVQNPIKYLKFVELLKTMNREMYYRFICENENTELTEHQTILFHVMNQTKKLPFINNHPSIRNFLPIQELLYSQIHLFEKRILDSGESVCVLKTFWIKCIQRKWKKIFHFNKTQLNEMKSLNYQKKKEIKVYNKRLLGIKGLWYSRL